ncbi:MAG: UDP-glycosyltransferase, partial [Flavobacterium sp.]
FINYDVVNQKFPDWSVKKIYNFIHFRSMPSKDSVFWLDNPNQIAEKIELMLSDKSSEIFKNAQKWFQKINQHPPENASERIWNAIEKIIKK